MHKDLRSLKTKAFEGLSTPSQASISETWTRWNVQLLIARLVLMTEHRKWGLRWTAQNQLWFKKAKILSTISFHGQFLDSCWTRYNCWISYADPLILVSSKWAVSANWTTIWARSRADPVASAWMLRTPYASLSADANISEISLERLERWSISLGRTWVSEVHWIQE